MSVMMSLCKSGDGITGETGYNPVAKFMHLFPNGFFKPTVETMASLYKSTVQHVELLFNEIRKLTDIEDNAILVELQKRSYQMLKFSKIKNYVQFIIDRLARLHVYANEIDVSDYFELFGHLLKRLLERWDQFFCAVFRIRFKIRNNSGVKHLKRYHKIAEFETQNIYRKISQLRLRIDSALLSCDIRKEENVKENFFDSLLIFRLEPYRFEARCLDDSESEEEDANRTSHDARRNGISMKRKRSRDQSKLYHAMTSPKRKRDSSSTVAGQSPAKEAKKHCDVSPSDEEAVGTPARRMRECDESCADGKQAFTIDRQPVCLKLKLKRDGEKWISSLDENGDKNDPTFICKEIQKQF